MGNTDKNPPLGPFTVMIARFPGNRQEDPDSSGWVMQTLLQITKDERIDEVLPWKMCDTPITMVRNTCVLDAQKEHVDYLLMIDSDMSPDCERDLGFPGFWTRAWEFMMERRQKEIDHAELCTEKYSNAEELALEKFPPATVAAPYCGPPPEELVYIFRWRTFEPDTVDPVNRLQMFGRDEAATKRGFEEVAALPTGLILYDMRVFDLLPPPWFDYEWGDRPYNTVKATTEDVFQTRNASLMGLPQFVDWDSWAAHIKPKKVGKPAPFSIASINEQFAQAVLRGRKRRGQ